MVTSASNGSRRRRPPRPSTARDLATVGAVVACAALAVAALVSPATRGLRSSIDDGIPFTPRGATPRGGEVAVEIRPGARTGPETTPAQPVTELAGGVRLPRLFGSLAGGAAPGGGTNRTAVAPGITTAGDAVGLVPSAAADQLSDLILDLPGETSPAVSPSELVSLPVPAAVPTESASTATFAAHGAGGDDRGDATPTGASKRRRPAGEAVSATSSGARAAAAASPRRPAAPDERVARRGGKGDSSPQQGRQDRGRSTGAGRRH